MGQVSTGVVVAGLALALGGGVAMARPSTAPPSTVATRAIDWAVETGKPVETHPEVAPSVTVVGDDVPEGTVDGFSVAELQDLTAAAEQFDETGAEVVAQAHRERGYLPVYEESSRSDGFAWGELGYDGGPSWIGFSGQAPPEVASAAKGAGIEVREDLPHSQAELEALVSTVHRAASAKGDAVTYLDESTSRIQVLTNAPEDDVRAAIATALSTSADRLSKDFPVDVAHRDGPLGGTDDEAGE